MTHKNSTVHREWIVNYSGTYNLSVITSYRSHGYSWDLSFRYRTFYQFLGDVDAALDEHFLDRVLIQLDPRFLLHVVTLSEEILHELRVRWTLHLIPGPSTLVLKDPRIKHQRRTLAQLDHHLRHESLIFFQSLGFLPCSFLFFQSSPFSR